VQNEGDAWQLSLGQVQRYYADVLTRTAAGIELPEMARLSGTPVAVPEIMHELIGEAYLGMIEKLAERTAEMHLSLASLTEPTFAPEAFTTLYQRSIYQAMCEQVKRAMILIGQLMPSMEPEQRELCSLLVKNQKTILQQFEPIRKEKIDTLKIRIHGDYHLGQVLLPARILSSLILKASLPGLSLSAKSNAPSSATFPGCFVRSIMRLSMCST